MWPQKKYSGWCCLDEVADGARAGVQTGAHLVERRAVGRSVADQDQRVEFAEALKPVGQLRLAVFAGRVERAWGWSSPGPRRATCPTEK